MTCPNPPVGLGGDNASEASEMNAWSMGRTFQWIGLDWIVEAGRDQICSCGSYLPSSSREEGSWQSRMEYIGTAKAIMDLYLVFFCGLEAVNINQHDPVRGVRA